MLRTTLALLLLSLFPVIAFAQTTQAQVIVGTGSVAGSGGTSDIMIGFRAYNSGQGGAIPENTVNGYRVVIGFAGAQPLEIVSGGGYCSFDSQRLTVVRAAAAGQELTTEITCIVRFSYNSLVLFTEETAQRQFTNVLGNPVSGVVTLGGLAPQNSPQSTPPAVTFNPAQDISLPVGSQGQFTRRNLRVRAVGGTGGLGMASVGACGVYRGTTATNLTAFIPGFSQYNFGAGSDFDLPITIECLPSAVQQRGLVYCIEGANPGATRLRFWNLTCPAGLEPGDGIFSDGGEI